MTKRIDLVQGMKVAVIGMARSGLAIAKLLKKYGAQTFISEIKPETELVSQVETLRMAGIEFETGGHTSRALENVDYVVVSPGVDPQSTFIKEIESHNITIFSEIEVSSWLCAATIIAITGSNGKSTTTALTAHVLDTPDHKAVATGNIGSPFATDLDQLTESDYAVVEVSSFQLERTESFKPRVSAILNITPDHLDRYNGFNNYAEMKYRIADEQDENDFTVLNYDDPRTADAKLWGKPKRLYFSSKQKVPFGVYVHEQQLIYDLDRGQGKICSVEEIGIPGPHNVANAAAAAAIALAIDTPVEQLAERLRSFTGIPHRLEHVTDINGVRFVNDSKATNVDSVYCALQSVNRPTILIMGGRDKGGDFSALVDLVSSRVKLLLLIGEAAPKIEKALAKATETLHVEDIFKAVQTGFSQSNPGDLLLLSPGCASFDQFKDFEERGELFKQAVYKLRNGNG